MVDTETVFDLRPISGALGVEIRGIDLENLTESEFERVHELLSRYLVVFFPDAAGLSPQAHKAFGRRLGELEVHPFLPKLPGHEEIVVLDSARGFTADVWHTDVTFVPGPPIASILRIVQCPPSGGDTMWSNQYLAYESLSAPLRDLLDGLTAIHSAAGPDGTVRGQAEHPVVRTHPVTGRRSLYVNPLFTARIPQLRQEESDLVLRHLYTASTRPENVCRFRWSTGAIAIWDNRATQHYAINDYTGRRVGQRVTILGDTPRGNQPRWPHHADAEGIASANRA